MAHIYGQYYHNYLIYVPQNATYARGNEESLKYGSTQYYHHANYLNYSYGQYFPNYVPHATYTRGSEETLKYYYYCLNYVLQCYTRERSLYVSSYRVGGKLSPSTAKGYSRKRAITANIPMADHVGHISLPIRVDINLIHAAYSTKLLINICLLYTSPSPRDLSTSRMPSSA